MKRKRRKPQRGPGSFINKTWHPQHPRPQQQTTSQAQETEQEQDVPDFSQEEEATQEQAVPDASQEEEAEQDVQERSSQAEEAEQERDVEDASQSAGEQKQEARPRPPPPKQQRQLTPEEVKQRQKLRDNWGMGDDVQQYASQLHTSRSPKVDYFACFGGSVVFVMLEEGASWDSGDLAFVFVTSIYIPPCAEGDGKVILHCSSCAGAGDLTSRLATESGIRSVRTQAAGSEQDASLSYRCLHTDVVPHLFDVPSIHRECGPLTEAAAAEAFAQDETDHAVGYASNLKFITTIADDHYAVRPLGRAYSWSVVRITHKPKQLDQLYCYGKSCRSSRCIHAGSLTNHQQLRPREAGTVTFC